MKTFTINGVTYTAKAFDFNLIADLEDYGVKIEDAGEKPIKMLRAYFALSAGISAEEAGEQIGQHIVKGGSFDELASAMSAMMDESDFFRSINKGAEKTIATSKTTQRKKVQ